MSLLQYRGKDLLDAAPATCIFIRRLRPWIGCRAPKTSEEKKAEVES
jgi:hypothetical protein